MVTPRTSVPHVIAVLKRPKNRVPVLVSIARGIVAAMTDNPRFPSPDPPLATLEAAIDDLANAEAATHSGLKESFPARDEKRDRLWKLLDYAKAYVQKMADAQTENAAEVIESAGMFVKKRGTRPPRTFGPKPGRVSGSVVLRAPRRKEHDVAYQWQYSLDGRKTLVDLEVTVKATTTLTGLPQGALASFRYRTVTKDGAGDWSDWVAIIVG